MFIAYPILSVSYSAALHSYGGVISRDRDNKKSASKLDLVNSSVLLDNPLCILVGYSIVDS